MSESDLILFLLACAGVAGFVAGSRERTARPRLDDRAYLLHQQRQRTLGFWIPRTKGDGE